MLRFQLPVYSPVSFPGLCRGILPGRSVLGNLTSGLASAYQAETTVLTASGTVALALCYLAAAPDGARPRIALPAWACPDLISAADAVNAEVVLYDLDPHTLSPDLGSVRTALTSGVHAVVVAHWFGLPVDIAALQELTTATGAWVIDDAAQGVGTSMGGRPAGSLGDWGILSFGRGKGRTGGGGGAALGNTADAAARLQKVASRLLPADSGLRGWAGVAAQWVFGRPPLYGIPARLPGLHLGETLYHPAPALRGMAVRAAAVVHAMWSESEEEVVIRRDHAARWATAISGQSGITIYPVAAGGEAGWLRFPLAVQKSAYAALISSTGRRFGVAPGYLNGLWELPLAQGRILRVGSYTGASTLCRTMVTLPTHGLISISDFAHILTLVQSM